MEIKFRAWDKRNKKMLSWWDINDRYNFQSMIYGNAMNSNFYDVMQYTGLKDKNGTEIYEGDVVLISHQERDYSTKSTFMIGTNKHLFGYEFVWEPVNGYFCPTHILEKDYSNCEIIGNIYENLELLEVI